MNQCKIFIYLTGGRVFNKGRETGASVSLLQVSMNEICFDILFPEGQIQRLQKSIPPFSSVSDFKF